MSPNGQPRAEAPDPAAICVRTFDMQPGQRFDLHDHETHQLAWSPSGVLTVDIGDRSWVLPPTMALWIPAGVPHATGATRPALMRSVYLPPAHCPAGWHDPTVVGVGPLLRELITHLAAPDLGPGARSRAEAVLFDLLRPVGVTTIDVPMPLDTRARRVAEALIAHPSDERTLDGWGREVGASGRTLARLFAAETGMPFGRWRTRVRLRAALGHLAANRPLASVARRVGYSTPSAFVAAFRLETGRTPGAYFADPPRSARG
ncbi:AraC family transcriptional regulator [Peterkaempfera bronchialis]|uniref:HTH-type transcriptional regulator RipA n=1 Tax=Peterkaempfera bronchialis TaxID=2126346 RepID=A0A345T2Y3_9ACTN|nr:helix-turn-helix transcriptional regulator [Peterkaempfera bronchialis]AXI80338.1 AraC family transcriptional regulator [Peterkaempfera bronchialis]